MIDPQQLQQIVTDVRRALVRYHRPALAVFGGVCALTVLGLLFMPRSYESEAKLFVRFGRENSVDPTASGQMVSIYESRESEVNSLLEILSSQTLLERVTKKLGPEYILYGRETEGSRHAPTVTSDKQPSTKTKVPSGEQIVSSGIPDRSVQLAVQKLRKQLEVWSPKRTNVIAVRCEAESPEKAQRIVATLIDTYLAEHVRVHQTAGSYEFFAEQEQRYEDEWKQAATELRRTKDQLGIVTIDGKRQLLQSQIQDIETKLLTNRSDLTTSEARIASLQQALAKLPERVVTQTQESANAAADGMRQTLFTLEGREKELASKYTDEHIELQRVREQVQSMKSILANQEPLREQDTEAVNPQWQALELTLLQEQSQVDALRGREVALEKQHKQLQRDLRTLNGEEIKIAELQRSVELAEARYREYAAKLEQARISRSLDEERISSLSVVQPASYVAKALGPRRLHVLALGFFVGVGGALGLAFALNWLNPVLRSADELELILETPVLGVVPAPMVVCG